MEVERSSEEREFEHALHSHTHTHTHTHTHPPVVVLEEAFADFSQSVNEV